MMCWRRETDCTTHWVCAAAFVKLDIDISHDTEVKPWMRENADSRRAYNESHLCNLFHNSMMCAVTLYLVKEHTAGLL
jgi:hypothetical protein